MTLACIVTVCWNRPILLKIPSFINDLLDMQTENPKDGECFSAERIRGFDGRQPCLQGNGKHGVVPQLV